VEYARVHAWKGDLEQAIELFAALEPLYPQDRDVLLGKGQSLQWSGRPREAERILSDLRKRYPDDHDVRLALAGAQLALGRGDRALRELQGLGSGTVNDPDLQSMRTLALRQVRPVLVVSYNPSTDSDDLEIRALTSTLYFSAFPRMRSYVRGLLTPSTMPSQGTGEGREALVGSTVHIAPLVVGRGEAGVNVGSGGRTSAVGGGGATLLPTRGLRLDIDAARQFLNYLPLSFQRDISRVVMRTSADVRPTRRVLLHADYSHGWYSDTNRAHTWNIVASHALVQRSQTTLEAGYLYSMSDFAKQTAQGYYAPSRLQRHAGLVNLFRRPRSGFGYSVAGTLGAEREADAPFRLDGSIRIAADVTLAQRLTLSAAYAYSRVTTLSRSGAYAAHAVTSGLEVRF
jgi:hypothetical protein